MGENEGAKRKKCVLQLETTRETTKLGDQTSMVEATGVGVTGSSRFNEAIISAKAALVDSMTALAASI